MKFEQHYLSTKNYPKSCPLNRDYACDGLCAWFDHEYQDCRRIGGFMKVREGLTEIDERLFQISEEIKKGLDALFQKT